MRYNLKLNEEIQIIDPALAQKYNDAQKQINTRLKKINQLQSEIVTYKQQMSAAQEQAMKDNQAQIKQSQETQQQNQAQQNTSSKTAVPQPIITQPAVAESIRVDESLESYILEDEEDDEDILDEGEEELDYAEEYDEKVGDEDEFLFYFKIADELDDDAVYKAYKDFDEDRWELKVVEGESNQALEETTFETDFSKLEIINYLAEIYGDVEEIFEDEFDDKLEKEKEYFNETVIPNKYFNIK